MVVQIEPREVNEPDTCPPHLWVGHADPYCELCGIDKEVHHESADARTD